MITGAFLLLAVTSIFLQVKVHAKRIKEGRMTVAYKRWWAAGRGAAILIAGVGFMSQGCLWWVVLPGMAASALLFAALFDPLLSVSVGWSPWYLGKTSWWDYWWTKRCPDNPGYNAFRAESYAASALFVLTSLLEALSKAS